LIACEEQPMTCTTVSPTERAVRGHAALSSDDWVALRTALPADNLRGALACAGRLHAVLPDPVELERNVVLVAYGGGKDSSYMLAFVRAVQLVLQQLYGRTFRMRSCTNRHAGMPRAVMENIDRVYRTLHLFEDPLCELLLVDGDDVHPFSVDDPQRESVVARNRLDILMSGHRTGGDGRPTFCNACNLSMANSFGVAAAYDGGVDVIVTGDSKDEQRAYSLWVSRLARQYGASRGSVNGRGFRGFLEATDSISRAYFTELYGDGATGRVGERRVATEVPESLSFFSIYEDTQYSSGEHWDFLTRFLGFRFDDLAFSFTESDCGNPTLMAHLRALKCEHVYGRSYAEGLDEYVRFGLVLMGKKEFPEPLIERMRERYCGPGAVERMREAADDYAFEAYGHTETQLVCMVWAPFVGKGQRLADYLAAERPGLAERVDDIHDALLDVEGYASVDPALVEQLEELSGLTLEHLRTLYASSARDASLRQPDIFGAILAGDPHKEVIVTRHAPDGPAVTELVSGR
jgi:hypothetical protein